MSSPRQIGFDFNRPVLPLPERIPTNLEEPKLKKLIREDFEHSSDYLVITGFSSLELLLTFFREVLPEGNRKSRVLLGHEDLRFGQVKTLAGSRLSQEIIDYWLERGFSVSQYGAVLNLIELIEQGRVEFRILQGLHAKIYLGDRHAVLGSSNFSYNGLVRQLEANLRIGREQEEKRFEEIRQVATYYWDQGMPFNEQILKLLKELLAKVSWRQALARAAALLIEGDWWKSFRHMEQALRDFRMWPSQERGIGKALYILDQQGSVLVADPTGSGKTRMGAALHLALRHRLVLSGRHFKFNELLLCPPRVKGNWEEEYLKAGDNFNSIVSHGILSSGAKVDKERALKRLRNARILLVDEAHNFIDKKSNRSQEIAKSLAEHVILFTATPINRRVEDLFRLIELLDIDNFPDEVIELYKKYAFRRSGVTDRELDEFRGVLRHFVVRRTKEELNRLIDREPECYHNALGKECRYPRQNEVVYALGESDQDVAIARQINTLAGQLRGISRLQSIKHPLQRFMDADEQDRFLKMRLKSSAGLARYMVQNMLRSSAAALLEHIYGSGYAARHYGLKKLPSDKDTGDAFGTVRKLMHKFPETNLTKVSLPVWLREKEAYRQACEEEIARYEQIGQWCKQLSDGRERAKMAYLKELLSKHSLLIAFDHRIISLHLFQKMLGEQKVNNILVTGSSKTELEQATETFRLGSDAKGIVGLFSDSMSEGVNLQGASALVMLDMPTVVRLAEQRIGRVDRMDSPHQAVTIAWPDDHPEFALKTDNRFFKTSQDVRRLIGGNFNVPEQLRSISGKEAIQLRQEALRQEEQEMEELLPDAGQSVEDLVSGETALITPEEYEELRQSAARVYSNVSYVRAKGNWAFFALEGGAEYAPRWVLFDPENRLITDLPGISAFLQETLPECEDIDGVDEQVSAIFDRFIHLLNESGLGQLSLKKQRAIQLLEDLLKRYLKDSGVSSVRKKHIRELQNLLVFNDGEFTIDLDHFGQKLIRYFQPELQKMRIEKPRSVITMKSLKKPLIQNPIPNEVLKEWLTEPHLVRSLDRRVVACIIGVATQ